MFIHRDKEFSGKKSTGHDPETLQRFFSSSSPGSQCLSSCIKSIPHVLTRSYYAVGAGFRPPSPTSHTSSSSVRWRRSYGPMATRTANRWLMGGFKESSSQNRKEGESESPRPKHRPSNCAHSNTTHEKALWTPPPHSSISFPGGCIMMNDVCITGRHH